MDLRDMQLFVATIEHGSVLRASRVENISQPALTRRIQNLEQDLQVKLIERTNRGVRLTAEGALFYERACALVTDARRLRQDMRRPRGDSGGKLAVGVGVGCEALFGLALRRFSERRDRLDLSARVGFVQSLLAQMRAGQLDMVFAMDPLAGPTPEFETSYVGEMISNFACRADHPMLSKAALGPEDLAAAPWAIWDLPIATRFLDANFVRLGFGPPQISLRTNACEVMKAAILHSDCIALVPRHVVAEEIARGEVVVVEGILEQFVNRLIVAHAHAPHLTAAGRGLILAIREAIRASNGDGRTTPRTA